MKKNDWKYLIDVLLFVSICAITAIGLVLAFVIPTGRAGRGEDVSRYFLGLHRHEWGDIHLYLSLFMLVLLIFHVWFNWAWVAHWSKNYFGKHWKKTLCALCTAWIIVLIIAWAIALV